MSKFAALLLERCARAGAAAAIGAISTQLAVSDLNLTAIKTIAIAAGAAAVSAILSVLSQFVGDPESTSFTKTIIGR